MAERAGLENRRWGNLSASSNLAPSAIFPPGFTLPIRIGRPLTENLLAFPPNNYGLVRLVLLMVDCQRVKVPALAVPTQGSKRSRHPPGEICLHP